MKGKSGTDMAKQKSLAELLAKQPPALQASKNAEALETPFFDQVVEQADSTATASFEALLTEITGAVDPANIPRFPTSQCLSPEDVYNLESIGLQQQDHLSGCPWCKNMVAAAQPSEEEFTNLLAKCRRASRAQRAQRNRETAASC
jgi:hypothetical protein